METPSLPPIIDPNGGFVNVQIEQFLTGDLSIITKSPLSERETGDFSGIRDQNFRSTSTGIPVRSDSKAASIMSMSTIIW